MSIHYVGTIWNYHHILLRFVPASLLQSNCRLQQRLAQDASKITGLSNRVLGHFIV